MHRTWAPLPEWETLYEVHPLGFVRRIGKIDPLKTITAGAGYLTVKLSDSPRHVSMYVHRAVLFTFEDTPPEGHEADHRDQDKTNNRLDNLHWVTHKENCTNRNNVTPHEKLVPAQVKVIRERMIAGERQYRIALAFGVCKQVITNIKKGATYAHC